MILIRLTPYFKFSDQFVTKFEKERNNGEMIFKALSCPWLPSFWALLSRMVTICTFFYTTQNLRQSHHSAATTSPNSHHLLPLNHWLNFLQPQLAIPFNSPSESSLVLFHPDAQIRLCTQSPFFFRRDSSLHQIDCSR